MRLLNAKTKQFEEFVDDNVPPYAILSHTWGQTELLYRDVLQVQQAPSVSSPPRIRTVGCPKIDGCCYQALRDGLEWAWIDTCCINKDSSAELSEAINSMFRWYRNAKLCYAYLSDVHDAEDSFQSELAFRRSRWFRRGWTLQELIAPRDVVFYGSSWAKINTRIALRDVLQEITGIPQDYLANRPLSQASIAQKMSWAAMRTTTRKEDIAYCLLGIFDVNMPLLYGESDKAFLRLQEEILKVTDDQSILAWGLNRGVPCTSGSEAAIFAQSPLDFEGCGDVVQCRAWETRLGRNIEMTRTGLLINMPLDQVQRQSLGLLKRHKEDDYNQMMPLGLLNCRSRHDFTHVIAIPLILERHPEGILARRAHFRNPEYFSIRRKWWTIGNFKPRLIYITPANSYDPFMQSAVGIGNLPRVILLELPATCHYHQAHVSSNMNLVFVGQGIMIKEQDLQDDFRLQSRLGCHAVIVYRHSVDTHTQSQSETFMHETILVEISWAADIRQSMECRVCKLDHSDSYPGDLEDSHLLQNLPWSPEVELNGVHNRIYTKTIHSTLADLRLVKVTTPVLWTAKEVADRKAKYCSLPALSKVAIPPSVQVLNSWPDVTFILLCIWMIGWMLCTRMMIYWHTPTLEGIQKSVVLSPVASLILSFLYSRITQKHGSRFGLEAMIVHCLCILSPF